jgi:prefoldin subunit 5
MSNIERNQVRQEIEDTARLISKIKNLKWEIEALHCSTVTVNSADELLKNLNSDLEYWKTLLALDPWKKDDRADLEAKKKELQAKIDSIQKRLERMKIQELI